MINRGKMYKEVYCILEEYIPTFQRKKIPDELVDKIKKYMDKEYDFKVDKNVELTSMELLPETKAFLIEIYNSFFASLKEKEIINKYKIICMKKKY